MVSRQPKYVMHDPITKGILDFKDSDGLRCCLVQQHFRFKTSVTLELRVLSLVANSLLCAPHLAQRPVAYTLTLHLKYYSGSSCFFSVVMWPRLNKTASDNCWWYSTLPVFLFKCLVVFLAKDFQACKVVFFVCKKELQTKQNGSSIKLRGMASTWHMRTAISPGQWQPWQLFRPHLDSSEWHSYRRRVALAISDPALARPYTLYMW